MIYFLIYIIKSTLCLTLFYLFFKALLSRETFFRFNRFVLIAGMIVCAVLPLIELKVSQTNIFQEHTVQIENYFIFQNQLNTEIITDDYLLNESGQTQNIPLISSNSPLTSSNFRKILIIAYPTGFFITLFLLFVSIFKMMRIIQKGTKIRKGKYIIVCITKQICPFSWGRYIVLSEEDYRQNPNEIITHEAIHSDKFHSLDLLFAELFILFHWFNPVAWLLKGELQDIHEYEADRGVINKGIDATKYQLMLVKKAVGARSYAIANSFNHSKIKIKNRVTMMLKEKSTQRARLKLLLFVPLAVVLLQAFARPETVRIQESLIDSEVTTISQQSKKWTKDYFDEKIDAYVKKVNGNTKECEKWSQFNIELTDSTWRNYLYDTQHKYIIMAPAHKNREKPGFNILITQLIDEESKRCKKNQFSPSIVYLKIEDVSDSYLQELLDALGELNEEFLKAREEQKQKAWEINIKTTFINMYSDVPIYVAIDERIKQFPSLFNDKKLQSSNQQKAAAVLQKDIERNNESLKKIEGICDTILVKNLPKTSKKLVVKGSLVFSDGENEITLQGDYIEINLDDTVQFAGADSLAVKVI